MTSDQDLPNTVAPESLSRWMARPADEGPFWQRHRAQTQGPVVTPPEVKRSRVLMRTVVCALVIIGCIAIARGVWGASPADHMRPHEMTLLLPPQVDRVNIITISAAYPDRAACEKAKLRVVVKTPGAKLVCGIANPFRVR